MCIGAVLWYTLACTRELPGGNRNQYRLVDWIRERFIKETALNHAQRLEVVLHQNVEILCVRRLQVGISGGHWNVGVRIGIDTPERCLVPEVWSRYAHAISQAQRRI